MAEYNELRQTMTRPDTVLRASYTGECVAMLVAVYCFLMTVGWLAYAPITPATLIVSWGWAILRSVGFWSGKAFTPLVTLIGLAGTAWTITVIPDEIRNWLSKGPFGPTSLCLVQSGLILIDVCDIPWRRNWSERHSVVPLKTPGNTSVTLLARH